VEEDWRLRRPTDLREEGRGGVFWSGDGDALDHMRVARQRLDALARRRVPHAHALHRIDEEERRRGGSSDVNTDQRHTSCRT